jgi:tetratricopeptide (TPR) repeat protein
MATDWKIGDRIQNRWEIHKILRGGMGVVYIVYDHEMIGEFAPEPVMGAELDAVEWSNKGASLNELGHSEEAIVCYDRALEINPRFVEAWFNKGLALGKGFQLYLDALACFEEAHRSGDTEAAQAVAMCRQILGE